MRHQGDGTVTTQHKVPRSTIHIIAERCWQAGGHGSPRYVYLTGLDSECERQNTEHLVAYSEPVGALTRHVGDGRHHHHVITFDGWGGVGGLGWYKKAIEDKLREVWPLAAAAGVVS